MNNEGGQEFFVDQRLYYMTATNYGYIGFEPNRDLENYKTDFGFYGQDVQYTGSKNESSSYQYYVPGYGYAQSLYNPYNPFNPSIPGAMIGADGSFVGPLRYYGHPSYENYIVPHMYPTVVSQPSPNIGANGIRNFSHVDGAKHNFSTDVQSSSFVMSGDTSGKNDVAKVVEGSITNTLLKQPILALASYNFPSQTQETTQVLQTQGTQGKQIVSNEVSFDSSQLRTSLPSTNDMSFQVKPMLNDGKVKTGFEGNYGYQRVKTWGKIVEKSNKQWVVKASTTMLRNPEVQGNIAVLMDKYNGVDILSDYKYAKFFVIKSYSEDNVHKSIKYNMWSSTPKGNKKLNAAYESAKRVSEGDSKGCPIFLFFSVNASGQFCGVAEMIGPVDLTKNMDFWQQDIWSGYFPVKWHFVKDLPNSNLRHIRLGNNENKCVTYSRDTQEIPYKKGLEMLRIFVRYTLKTSLLNNFMYDENMQQIMQEDNSRVLMKGYDKPFLVPLVAPSQKIQQSIHDFPSFVDTHVAIKDTYHSTAQNKNNDNVKSSETKTFGPVSVVSVDTNIEKTMNGVGCNQFLAEMPSGSNERVLADVPSGNNHVPKMADELKMSYINISPQVPENKSLVSSEVAGIVTIGSMPVIVNEIKSASFLIVGSIPLDPRALQWN